jgi:hypothetical protein
MPGEATHIKDKLITLQACSHDGQFVIPESTGGGFGAGVPGGGGNFKENVYGQFSFCTGGSNGYLSDIAPSVSSTTTLIDPRRCPRGMTPYLTRLDIDVQGAVNWSITSPTTGIPTLSIQDTSGNPFVVAPFNALKGITELTFPDTETTIPLLLGANTVTGPVGTPVTTATWAAATGLLTAGAAVFPNSQTCMVGTPVSIVDGTGKGQTALVQTSASNSTTVIALGTSAFPTPPDATSVFAIWWQPLAAYTDTTHITLPNSGTPYTANAFDNGYQVLGVFGSGVGTARPILSNTNAGALVLTSALNTPMSATATLTTLSMLQITTDNQLNGAIDLCIGDKCTSAAINTGLQCVVNGQGGTAPLGSSVRLYGEGYWGN